MIARNTVCLALVVAAVGCGNIHRAGYGPIASAACTVRSVKLTIGGVKTTAELYTAGGDGKHPGVVLLYGSGGMQVAASAYRWYATSLADQGMTTIICPYFNSSHGRQHRDPANTRLWVPAVRDTITFLQHEPNVDPKAIGIIGFSLGGYLGMSTIPRDRRVRAFVDFFGPEPKLTAAEWSRFPPTLILHGGADKRVGISNSRDFDRRLTQAGIVHQLIIYPRQGHGFTEPAASDAETKAVAFLATHMGE